MIFKRQVVYLLTSPLSKRDYNRFGIQRWLDRGWDVKVFDFTKFLKPEFWDYVSGEQLSVAFDGLMIIEDKITALKLLQKVEEGAIFIDFLASSRAEQKIRREVRVKGLTLKFNLGSLPMKRIDCSEYWRKAQKVMQHPDRIIHYLINKFKKYQGDSPDYWVVGGTSSLHNNSRGNFLLIRAHNFDYDFFYTEKRELESNDNGLVFLDGDEAYHSDYVHSGIEPYVTAEKYYPLMDVSLLQIAESFGYDVRIAAHPRSDYDNKSIRYSLPILKDQTFELIKQSSVVVSHGSTSLQWAIIMRKPIILVTTDEMKKSAFNYVTEGFALALGKEVVNLNRIPNNFNWKSQLLIDETKYNNYIETYVKQSGTPEKPVWEIVIDRIETDLLNSKIQSL
ncbi:MAG: hypothetical protein ISR78_09285 [Spirochaetia bacterium]|nr:hypothetical protein [Spirochaetia bacterium]